VVAGFVHGVLNTDNINVTGESFDYGPYRFLPTHDPKFTAAYFDHQGLYAYGRQREALHWNCYQLAACFLKFAETADLERILDTFPTHFDTALKHGFCRRLGVTQKGDQADGALFASAERFLSVSVCDYQTFFHSILTLGVDDMPPLSIKVTNEIQAAWNEFSSIYRSYERSLEMGSVSLTNQNLLYDEIEAIWGAIAERDDWTPLYEKITQIRTFGERMHKLGITPITMKHA
ncbi:MAG: protein adenylyltransferase SelO family protein, partial [Pseudomonadota bacterium]